MAPMNLSINRNSLTDIENRLVVAEGKREMDQLGVWG